MAKIPGVTAPGTVEMPLENGDVTDGVQKVKPTGEKTENEDGPQFEMDI